MVQNGEAFIWIFGFALKNVGFVVTKLTEKVYNKVWKGDLEGLGH